jgi:hypothetical protein
MCNVFSDFNGETTNTLKVSRDGGTTFSTIILPVGNYSIEQLNRAINDSISAWITDAEDSSFNLFYKDPTGKCYIVIDSSKLTAPGTQFQINFDSDISKLVGTTTKLYEIDNTYTFEDAPKMNYFGDVLYVVFENGFGNLNSRNARSSNALCSVPLTKRNASDNFFYIQNNSITFNDCIIEKPLKGYSIKVKSDDGRDAVFRSGIFWVEFEYG